jgi:hypothetical protein
LLTVLESEDAEGIPGLLALAKQRSHERAEAETLIKTLKLERDAAAAKKRGLDPASAVQAIRRSWIESDDENERYGLRVRCNRAMRDFVNSIQFDSVEGSYTVMLFDGYRAYKFFNVPRVREATQKSLVVDMQPLVDTGLWAAHVEHEKAPLPALCELVNVSREAVLTKIVVGVAQE